MWADRKRSCPPRRPRTILLSVAACTHKYQVAGGMCVCTHQASGESMLSSITNQGAG